MEHDVEARTHSHLPSSIIFIAGVVDVSPFEDLDGEDFERVLGVNTVGCFLCMKHAAIK